LRFTIIAIPPIQSATMTAARTPRRDIIEL
jgi:hypothetical protein